MFYIATGIIILSFLPSLSTRVFGLFVAQELIGPLFSLLPKAVPKGIIHYYYSRHSLLLASFIIRVRGKPPVQLLVLLS